MSIKPPPPHYLPPPPVGSTPPPRPSRPPHLSPPLLFFGAKSRVSIIPNPHSYPPFLPIHSPPPSVPAGSPSRGGDVVHVFAIHRPSLPTPIHPVLVSVSVFMALSTVFLSTDSSNNSPVSLCVLPVLFWPYQSTIYIYFFRKVSLSPDNNPLWLTGLKAQTNSPPATPFKFVCLFLFPPSPGMETDWVSVNNGLARLCRQVGR